MRYTSKPRTVSRPSGSRAPGAGNALNLNISGELSEAARDARVSIVAPLLIATNGTTTGAGFSLALAGDLVIADRSVKFIIAYNAAGLTLDGGASFLLPRSVEMRRVQELATPTVF